MISHYVGRLTSSCKPSDSLHPRSECMTFLCVPEGEFTKGVGLPPTDHSLHHCPYTHSRSDPLLPRDFKMGQALSAHNDGPGTRTREELRRELVRSCPPACYNALPPQTQA